VIDRKVTYSDLIKHGVESGLRNLMVCLPGRVIAFDPGTQMAQVECGIQKRINGEFRTIPVISNVRVQFSGDGEWYFWHQVKPGTEGLIHFSQRAVDTWNDQGGPVAPHDLRMFSAEDAYFVPGIRSAPHLVPGFVNEGVGMSSFDGATRIHLTPGMISLKAAVLDMDAETINQASAAHSIQSGTLAVNANTAIDGTLANNGINVGSTHTHPITGGSSAPGPTGTPQ